MRHLGGQDPQCRIKREAVAVRISGGERKWWRGLQQLNGRKSRYAEERVLEQNALEVNHCPTRHVLALPNPAS